MEKQIIRNCKDANDLMHMGNICTGVALDKDREGYLVFFFNKTNKFTEDLEILTRIGKRKAEEWHIKND